MPHRSSHLCAYTYHPAQPVPSPHLFALPSLKLPARLYGPHCEEKKLAIEQIGELREALAHRGTVAFFPRPFQHGLQRAAAVPWEEDALSVRAVVQERDPAGLQVAAEVSHLGHQVCRPGATKMWAQAPVGPLPTSPVPPPHL